MKKMQWLIRISLLVLIVLLGLTALVPEWLELKDVIFDSQKSTYEDPNAYKQKWPYHLSQSLRSASKTIKNAPSTINHFILGPLADLDSRGMAGLIIIPFWFIVVTFTYILFLFSTLFFFFSFRFFTHKFIHIQKLNQAYPRATSVFVSITIFILALSIWPFILKFLIMLLSIGAHD